MIPGEQKTDNGCNENFSGFRPVSPLFCKKIPTKSKLYGWLYRESRRDNSMVYDENHLKVSRVPKWGIFEKNCPNNPN